MATTTPSISLDLETLRLASPTGVAVYLRLLLDQHAEAETCKALLAAVANESVAPTVIATWLSIARTATSVKDALLQDFSALTRRSAYKNVGKWLQSVRWREMWEALGGTEGILTIFSRLAVVDLKLLIASMTMARSKTDKVKQQAFTELLLALVPANLRPEQWKVSRFYNPDQRSSLRVYMKLLPCCTDEFIEAGLSGPTDWSDLCTAKLIISHTKLIQKLSQTVNLKALPGIGRLCVDLPACKGDEKGFSAPMSFGLTLLKVVTTTPKGPADFSAFRFPTVICDLISRAMAKRVDLERLAQLTELGIVFYEQYPDYRKSATSEHEVLNTLVVRCWVRAIAQHRVAEGEIFKSQFLRLLPFVNYDLLSTNPCQKILKEFSESNRYGILELVLRQRESVEISTIEGLRKWQNQRLETSFFSTLPRPEGIALLERLMEAKPECDFLQGRTNRGSSPDTLHNYDCNLLLVELHEGDSISVAIATKQIDVRKTQAIKSREPTGRAFYAASILWYAIASKSLDVLYAVLEWLKRFNRDPLTTKLLYSSQTLAGISYILCGLNQAAEEISQATPQALKHIQESIIKANTCLTTLLEVTISALREPSFYAGNWRSVIDLFMDVLRQRVDQVSKFAKQTVISPQILSKIVWEPTLDLLVGVEKKLLEVEYPNSRFNQPGGPLDIAENHGSNWMPKRPDDSQASVIRFLQNYVIARDRLWCSDRMKQNPDTTLVPQPFPQGLPLDHLLDSITLVYSPQIPYMVERASKIALLDVELATAPVPSSDDIKSAIGWYVERLETAIKIFIGAGPTVELQRKRLQEVWSHWMNILCLHDGMSEDDASSSLSTTVRCFKIFQKELLEPIGLRLPAWPEDKTPEKYEHYPARPGVSMAIDTAEWDPAVEEPKSTKSDNITPKLLDCLLTAYGNRASGSSHFAQPQPRTTKARTVPAFWDYSRIKAIGQTAVGEVIEGVILSLLLYLDGKKTKGKRLLASPFPSSGSARYPAIYVDLSFLERKDLDTSRATSTLSKFIDYIPPTLLFNASQAHLDVFFGLDPGSAELAASEKTAFHLLKLLASCDRPQLASRLIVETILQRPDSSSWHRQLLTTKYMRRLPPAMVLEFLSFFVTEITSKLQSQKMASRKRDKDGNQLPQSSVVKVTTVKLFVQLLKDGDFVPQTYAVAVLSELFKQAEHIDIRLEIAAALYTIWNENLSNEDDKLAEAAMSALELTLPVISAINERQPLSEAEWVEAYSTLTVPETSAESNVWPPMLQYLVCRPVPKSHEKQYFDRILKPALPTSRENNQRWLTILLKKHGDDLTLAEEIALPFGCVAFGTIIDKYYQYLSKADLIQYQRSAMMNLEPSAAFQKISTHFKSSNELKSSPDAKGWFGLYDSSTNSMRPTFALGDLLCKAWRMSEVAETSGAEGITVKDIQMCVMQEAHALIYASSGTGFSNWRTFTRVLRPYSHSYDIHSTSPDEVANAEAWLAQVRPLIQRLATRIDSLRDSEWQRNPYRHPAVLPSTIPLKIWTRRLPFLNSQGSIDERHELFATDLYNILDEAANSELTTPFQTITEIRSIIQSLPKKDLGLFRIACSLGALATTNANLSRTKMLAIYIAGELIGKNAIRECVDEAVLKRVKEMVISWSRSSIEEVRMKGLALLESPH